MIIRFTTLQAVAFYAFGLITAGCISKAINTCGVNRIILLGGASAAFAGFLAMLIATNPVAGGG